MKHLIAKLICRVVYHPCLVLLGYYWQWGASTSPKLAATLRQCPRCGAKVLDINGKLCDVDDGTLAIIHPLLGSFDARNS